MIELLIAAEASEPAELWHARLGQLRQCIQELSAKDRQMLDQRYSEGQTIVSLAGFLGRTPQSVCNSLRRIRQQLYRCVESRLAVGES